MLLTKDVLTGLGVTSERADKFLASLNDSLAAHAIDTPLRVAHFLAQVLHESGKMRWVEENLNYSADALLRVFPRYFSQAQANDYARNPQRIGNRVYGNRMGNGDEASGDGYRYRGRGLIQLTGKNNYRAFSNWINDDVLAAPDRVADRYAVHSAVFYWNEHNINAAADRDDIEAVTKIINNGLNGLDDRKALLQEAKRLIALLPQSATLAQATYTVVPKELNLRREPRVADSTWMAKLPQGMQVTLLGDATVSGWSQIRAVVDGRPMEGFVATRYLKEASPIAETEV